MSAFLNDRWTVFVKAAEFGSFSRAANFFNLPQSNVSRQIAQLEEELGARLFHRNGRGVSLSEVGQRLLPRLIDLCQQADLLSDQILTQGQTPIGEVRVGLIPLAVPALAAGVFRAVRSELPQVELHFCEGTSSQLSEFLEEGRIDLATVLHEHDETTPTQGNDLICTSLELIGPTGAPLIDARTTRFRHLDGIPLIAPSVGHPLRSLLARLAKKQGISLNIAVEADSMRLQHEVSLAGGGYAVTAGFNKLHAIPGLSSSTIVEPRILRSVALIASLRRPDTLAARAVERIIRKVAPDLFRKQVP